MPTRKTLTVADLPRLAKEWREAGWKVTRRKDELICVRVKDFAGEWAPTPRDTPKC
ncbi:MAG: hypothetical protein ACRD3D_01115 [Terriglobia bacterium]